MDVVPKSLGHSYFVRLQATAAPMSEAGLHVYYGGDFDQLVRPKSSDARSELIGFAVFVVVLIVGFGSVAAAGLPLMTAVFSVLVRVSALGIASSVASFGTASLTLALINGLCPRPRRVPQPCACTEGGRAEPSQHLCSAFVLSICAVYGVLVAVFEWGQGRSISVSARTAPLSRTCRW